MQALQVSLLDEPNIRLEHRCMGLAYHLAPALGQVISALGIVFLKMAMNEAPVDSVAFSFWRFVGATPLLIAMTIQKGVPIPSARETAWFALLGVLLVGNQLFANLGVQFAGALIATCMQPTSPALSYGMAVVVGQERVTVAAIAGIAISVAGSVVVAAGRGHNDGVHGSVCLGFVCLLVNSGCFAAYCVCMKLVAHERSAAVVITAASQAFGLVAMAAVMLARQALAPAPPPLWLPRAAFGALAYWVVLVSVVAYLLFSWASRRLPASTVALYAVLQPAVGAALSVVFLGDQLQRTDLGALGIALGLVLVVRPRVGRAL